MVTGALPVGWPARRFSVTPGIAAQDELGLERLTAREHEVLCYLTAGCSNPEIASRLVIGRGTVKGYVENIIHKLGVSDRTQAAVKAVQLGLVPVPVPAQA